MLSCEPGQSGLAGSPLRAAALIYWQAGRGFARIPQYCARRVFPTTGTHDCSHRLQDPVRTRSEAYDHACRSFSTIPQKHPERGTRRLRPLITRNVDS
jgi:hypothetical protein